MRFIITVLLLAFSEVLIKKMSIKSIGLSSGTIQILLKLHRNIQYMFLTICCYFGVWFEIKVDAILRTFFSNHKTLDNCCHSLGDLCSPMDKEKLISTFWVRILLKKKKGIWLGWLVEELLVACIIIIIKHWTIFRCTSLFSLHDNSVSFLWLLYSTEIGNTCSQNWYFHYHLAF